jgi:hypothetical protein
MDCSRRGDVVLDAFGGSGTTLVAAETCGRRGRLIEYDPIYCDTIIARWQTYTDKQATLGYGGSLFEKVAEDRLSPPTSPVSRRRARKSPAMGA